MALEVRTGEGLSLPELRLAQDFPNTRPDIAGQFYNSRTGQCYGAAIRFIVYQVLGMREFTFPGMIAPTKFYEFVVILLTGEGATLEAETLKLSLRNRHFPLGRRLECAFREGKTRWRAKSVLMHARHGKFHTWDVTGETPDVLPAPDLYAELGRLLGCSREEAKSWNWRRMYGGAPQLRIPDLPKVSIDIETSGMDLGKTKAWTNILGHTAPITGRFSSGTQAEDRTHRAGIKPMPAVHIVSNFDAADFSGIERRIFDLMTGRNPMHRNTVFVRETSTPNSMLTFNDVKSATEYAVGRTDQDGREREVLQVVRVIKRKPQPTVVETVKVAAPRRKAAKGRGRRR